MPAATKGFLDRVLAKGVMYEELPQARGNPFRSRMTSVTARTPEQRTGMLERTEQAFAAL